MNFEELWKIEEGFWLDGSGFYETSMASDALMVFPEPVGILAGLEIFDGLRQAPRWNAVDFRNKTETKLGDTIVLAYEAEGERESDDTYTALCTSTYVNKDNKWVLLAHQQTPKT